jgi:hypothetical protein
MATGDQTRSRRLPKEKNPILHGQMSGPAGPALHLCCAARQSRAPSAGPLRRSGHSQRSRNSSARPGLPTYPLLPPRHAHPPKIVAGHTSGRQRPFTARRQPLPLLLAGFCFCTLARSSPVRCSDGTRLRCGTTTRGNNTPDDEERAFHHRRPARAATAWPRVCAGTPVRRRGNGTSRTARVSLSHAPCAGRRARRTRPAGPCLGRARASRR